MDQRLTDRKEQKVTDCCSFQHKKRKRKWSLPKKPRGKNKIFEKGGKWENVKEVILDQKIN